MPYRRIRELREDNDIKQWQVAKAIGVTERAYSRYENAQRTIPLEVLIALSNYHNTSIDYLLGQTDVKEPYPRSNKTQK